MSGTAPDQVIVRRRAAHTQRHLRRVASWQRSALAACSIAMMLILLSGSSAAVTASTPDQIGDWSAPVAWPLVAVHMSLEPTGLVFMLDGFDAGPNSERLWDPASGTFIPVPYARNLFCSGHIQLADGRTLIVGGHINANEGLADTTIFDPTTRTYTRAPDMSVGRWYPTATELPDGRVLTLRRRQHRPGSPGSRPAILRRFRQLVAVDLQPEDQHLDGSHGRETDVPALSLHVRPLRRPGRRRRPGQGDPHSRPATSTWSTVGTSPFDGHSAVMYRPNKIMKSGAWSDPDFNGALTYDTTGRTAVIDMSAGTPTWRETAPMAFHRGYHNLTLLPDGTVLASGGGSKSDGRDIANSVLPAEIWNPDTETWTTVESLQNGRLYHSTALLLPDGRVLMAGGAQLPGSSAVDQRTRRSTRPRTCSRERDRRSRPRRRRRLRLEGST